jgi:RNA polymerase sigma-70 factor (ECF subfamily)
MTDDPPTDTPLEGGSSPEDLTRSFELVQRAQDGDMDAYNRLFERYYDRVLRIVRIRLGTRIRTYLEAEDIIQETFIAAVKNFDRFEMRHEAALIAWLSRLAEHKIKEALDYHHALKRDRRRERALGHVRTAMASGTLVFDPPATLDLPVDRAGDQELTAIMEECLTELTDDHREVILLRLYHKGSWAWVAEQMGRPTDAAARELFRRAKVALVLKVGQRTRLEDQG